MSQAAPVAPSSSGQAGADQGAPSAELFFTTVNAYQQTAALKGALELELFSAIAEGLTTPAELAERCKASEHGVRILGNYLCALGFLTKKDGRFGLTPDSAFFLDRKSPAYVGGMLAFLNSAYQMENFSDMAAVVRKGGTLRPDGAVLAPENPTWVTFAKAMMPMMRMPAEAIAQMMLAGSTQKMKVLDIAGGHGLFGIAFARHNPHAEVVVQDWANVLEVARENAAEAGVAARYRTLPGDAFSVDFGSGYDVVLLTNFLHHFDVPTNERLLAKVRAALAPEGRVVTLEFVPNEDGVSPRIPAMFGLMMLGTTPAGDAYTFRQLEAMFRNAGFSRNELYALPASPQHVLVSQR